MVGNQVLAGGLYSQSTFLVVNVIKLNDCFQFIYCVLIM